MALDSRYVATASRDRTCRVWELATGTEITQVNLQEDVRRVAFSPDGGQLAIGTWNGNVHYKQAANYSDRTAKLVNLETESVEREFNGHDGWLTALDVRSDGRQFVTASEDKTIRTWDLDSAQLEQTLIGHTDSVSRVSYLANGQQIASLGDDRTLRLWNARDGREIQQWIPSESETL